MGQTTSLVCVLPFGFMSRNQQYCSNIAALPNPYNCAVAPGTNLRILALGDSITYGWLSSNLNGYRQDLIDILGTRCSGRSVTFIGSQKTGDMPQNSHEGYPGYTIAQIANNTSPQLAQTLALKPNVVLLHAGTNDVASSNTSMDATAPQRLGSLMDQIFRAVPSTTLLVAQIISFSGNQARVDAFNAQIPAQVQQRVNAGKKVLTVNMTMIGANGMNESYSDQDAAHANDPCISSRGVNMGDLADGVHPNDCGFQKMAIKWFEGLEIASNKSWIAPPA